MSAPSRTTPQALDPKVLWGGGAAALILIALLTLGRYGIGIVEFVLIVGALLWLVSPLVGAWIWQRKGGNVAMGLLGGLFLGPLVLLMTFLDTGTKKCPACAQWVPKEANVCSACRSAF